MRKPPSPRVPPGEAPHPPAQRQGRAPAPAPAPAPVADATPAAPTAAPAAAGGQRRPRSRAGHAVDRPRTRELARPLGAADAADVLGSHEESVSEGLDDRLQERRDARRRLVGTRLAVVVGVLAALAALAWVVLASPLFALRADAIGVEGATKALSADDVRRTVEPFVGTPLARLDTGEVARTVSGLPLARDVTVTRDWPGGVTVTLRVRTAAMAEATGDTYRLVDDQGVVVAEGADTAGGLPVADLPDSGEKRTRAAAQVAAVWAALDHGLRAEVAGIASDGLQATLTLTGDRTVRWGTAEDSDLKARVLATLLAQRPARVYDVTTPTRPLTS